MLVPPISPSASTWVYRNSPQYGSSALHGLDGGQRQRRLPAVDDDLAAAAVHGGDDALGADGVGQLASRSRGSGARP